MYKLIENIIGIVVSLVMVVVMLSAIVLISKTDWAINIKDVSVFSVWALTVIGIGALWTDWDK